MLQLEDVRIRREARARFRRVYCIYPQPNPPAMALSSRRLSSSAVAMQRRLFSTARSSPVLSTMLPPGSFKGKIALVTGGGTGLGKGIATKLSDLGATVAIMSRKKAVVEQAASDIEAITGNSVIALQGDVRDADQVKAALDELDELAGVPTIVVNNAYVERDLACCGMGTCLH